MKDTVFLETLGMMIVMSGFLLVIAKKLSTPSIVLFIFAGLLLDPILGLVDLSSAFGADHHAEGANAAIAMMSHLGIALLLFLVGLELSLERIKDVGKVAAIAGLGQISLTAAAGFGISYVLGFSMVDAAFLAVALTFSSTVVVVKLVGQRKETDSFHGRIAVGVLLVQDLVVIIALTFLAGIGGEGSANGADMALDLAKAFAGMVVMLVGALILAKYVLPKPFEWAARRPEMLLIWSLALCFGSVVAAESLGLSPEIGAFLAGMSLAQLGCAHDLIRRLQALMNFFIAVFFVTLGAQMQLTEAGDQLVPAILLAIFVVIAKPVILIFLVSRLGYSQETSFKTGITLAQISEFSFILAAMGMSTGLIGKEILAVIAIVGLSTIILSSYLIIHLDWLFERVKQWELLSFLGVDVDAPESDAEVLSDHIIIIGMNSMGRRIAVQLHDQGETVLAIDTDINKVKDLECKSMLGNVEYLQVLEEAGFDRAKLVVSTLHIEDTNNLVAYHSQQAGVPCVVHGFDATVHDALRELGVTYLIDSKKAGVGVLVDRVLDLELQ